MNFKLDDVVQSKDTSNFVDPGVIVVGRRGDENNPKPQWMNDGSFLVFRKLEQHVGKWNDFVINQWKTAGSNGPAQFGAQLMGRWQSGEYVPLDRVALAHCNSQVVRYFFRINSTTATWL